MSKSVMRAISDIYIPRTFQWYKELFNPMSFDPCNCPLNIWGINWDSNSQDESSFGSVWVHSLTLFYIPGNRKCDSRAQSWPAPLQTLALVASPRLGLRHLTCYFFVLCVMNFCVCSTHTHKIKKTKANYTNIYIYI
jgi:hypothetical protein